MRRGCGRGLTSVGHHDFLDWSILALRGRVGVAGENARPPHGQQADAASDHSVPQHPKKRKNKINKHFCVLTHLRALSEGRRRQIETDTHDQENHQT